jgi:N-succinyldiaminopimelate aminotransferase
MYSRKFAAVTPLLAPVLDVALPDAGFYLWARLPDALGLSGHNSPASCRLNTM